MKKEAFQKLIEEAGFQELFNQLGWDAANKTQTIAHDGINYTFTAAAQKRDFVVFQCEVDVMPANQIRKTLDRRLSKYYFEHLIIFITKTKSHQLWQLQVRESNKPAQIREIHFHKGQDVEFLYQKYRNLLFTLDEEENITLIDVVRRIQSEFSRNTEKTTKKFYDGFKKQHTAFREFIEGIEKETEIDWYTSLMLNRLMFIYFIQKKNFLDNDVDYLRSRLEKVKAKKGKNKFYSFYREFLLVLFHQGLGAPDRNPEITDIIGKVPYLNGGLFDVHLIEEQHKKIQIKDDAFEKLFDFFDEYSWHLDTRSDALGNEINPDVIGYIFEKYINDRSAMGAYYTKEDITDYIAKNTILPFLFDDTETEYSKAFKPDEFIWTYLKNSGDTYIYDAVKHGISYNIHENKELENIQPLPSDIEAGVIYEKDRAKKDYEKIAEERVAKRSNWNTLAPLEFALPTEIWRETVERRLRYEEIKSKIENGEIQSITDFITYNLDIRKFTQNVLEETGDPKFIETFYKAIKKITILDPTCGSGAFLFAALNILEPLYETCLERMRDFIENETPDGKKLNFPFFNEELDELKKPEHPNTSYYIYKTIILNNLYGVDIMHEAVEIAKLRLFLKLVSTVDADYQKNNMGLEPLPDIDFNIRAGNTLVGFATYKQLQESLAETLDFDNQAEKFREQAEIVGKVYREFRDEQLVLDKGMQSQKIAKMNLQKRLNELNDKLDRHLFQIYNPGSQKEKDFLKWQESHQPFHWFSEFYEIIHENGGFNVIIGNPPYVEYTKVKNNYQIHNYVTIACGNLYAYLMERSYEILKQGKGELGVIIPLASFSTKRMLPLRNIYSNEFKYLFLSNFEATSNPTVLFIGVKVQLTIVIGKKAENINKNNISNIYTTVYNRCYSDERTYLFEKIKYTNANLVNNNIPKSGYFIENSIIKKIIKNKKLINFLNGRHKIFYRNMGNFFFKLAFQNEPKYFKNGIKESSSTVSFINFHNKEYTNILVGIINSTLFYYYWVLFSDCYHLSKSDIENFWFDFQYLDNKLYLEINDYSKKYSENIEKKAIWQKEEKKDGTIKKYRRYFPQTCKHYSDEIDKALAKHYGFNAEELDFIINYDIKYRMGLSSKSNDHENEEVS
ncbi:MAG: Eco57I restriction-modification methylase domain-containing protein [Spirochaetia bacterium]|nr:Eco57I restriction-modification methylase domain-containing protein [Spirochaetia bacterium]